MPSSSLWLFWAQQFRKGLWEFPREDSVVHYTESVLHPMSLLPNKPSIAPVSMQPWDKTLLDTHEAMRLAVLQRGQWLGLEGNWDSWPTTQLLLWKSAVQKLLSISSMHHTTVSEWTIIHSQWAYFDLTGLNTPKPMKIWLHWYFYHMNASWTVMHRAHFS